MRTAVLLLMTLCALTPTAFSVRQADTLGTGKIVDDDGTRIHVIGLKSKRPRDLVTAIRALHPSQALGACMADLKEELGYPDALVVYYPVGDNPFGGVLIAVVDPQDSARVNYRAKPTVAQALPTRWRDIPTPSLLGSRLQAIFRGYMLLLKGQRAEALQLADSYGVARDTAKAFWNSLRTKSEPFDRDVATEILAFDSVDTHRIVAAAVLMNFEPTQASWWALVEALRDPVNAVREVARFGLRGFVGREEAIPPVDWRPVAGSLYYLLNGTNPSAFLDLLDVLRKTRIDRALAATVLRQGNVFLSGFLEADYAPFRQHIVRFLQYLYDDSRDDVDYWRNRIARETFKAEPSAQ
ncbi:MAG: hypothetical protein D6800_09310 [Candidatus Zixiibacteriota bacterium]|nr:MAG: hypothetical protein D6800_09310 [candidate division Zixibacteria bacterium]